MNSYQCVHGVWHSREESRMALEWAARVHSKDELKPGECWIILYREAKQKGKA
jgi:hypothetical protein